ncbi:FAD-binding oxidoreductase [Leeia sp. TBRC 13508]|uniref:FAD-binding oxidoreductase n=1 Tax=Leeia speluncae TaxID=2884804 RepID=A0ABS8D8Z0_9NEIS|nr:FAD-binding and (Fe-S)-binding domain-containing protein [Leeia speluncae]MCB6184639.1 FAD-binding oxidoreductase [Leeia speluncae]
MLAKINVQDELPDLLRDFVSELLNIGFSGDVSYAYADRIVMSTDNSIYQVKPQLILFPAVISDVEMVMKLLGEERFREVKLAPRGGGTGTNGQSLTEFVVLDLSKHLNQILEINAEEKWARVQVGVVKDQLNEAIKPFGLFFAPELSTSNRATIGGMINTDASGQGSCLYGKTRDHVLALKTVFLGGEVIDSFEIDAKTQEHYRAQKNMEGLFHRVVEDEIRTHQEEIERIFPKLNRCMTGYDLAHVIDEQNHFHLNSILCGSEGTLGVMVEAKINLVSIPNCSGLFVVRYSNFDAALRDAPKLMAINAASIETVDSTVFQLAKTDNIWNDVKHLMQESVAGETQAINLVELIADDSDALLEKMVAVEDFLSSGGAGARLGFDQTTLANEVNNLWQLRKKAVGLLGGLAANARPVPFVEDTAVPPENLADYIQEFRALLDGYGLKYGMFGHVDAGVLHVRPALDMKDPDQEGMIRQISDAVVALTKKYKGLIWGEHGKGFRSEYTESYMGSLYPVLTRIKALFDPFNQLNPGKIASPDGSALYQIDRVSTRGQLDRQVNPIFQMAYKDAMNCNGNGACYNYDLNDSMCPSWKATRDRKYSPKGRASLLREWLRLASNNGVPAGSLTDAEQLQQMTKPLPVRMFNSVAEHFSSQKDFSTEVRESMDNCLGCKSCAGQCPVKVDIPTVRSSFFAAYYTRYARPIKHYLVASVETLIPKFSHAPFLYNVLTQNPFSKWGFRQLGLVHQPAMSGFKLSAFMKQEGIQWATVEQLSGLSLSDKERSIVLVLDAFTTYFDSAVLMDAVRLLKKLGYMVWIAPFSPNGKPLHVLGFLAKFKQVAERNALQLNALATIGVSLVGLDPSMSLTYRSEYQKSGLNVVAPNVMLLQERLVKDINKWPDKVPEQMLQLLPHCSERTNAAATLPMWQTIFARFGVKLTMPKTGCCGMAGTFGHELSNRQLSETIYQQSWAHALRETDVNTVMATGYSCRCQVDIMEQQSIRHPVSVLLSIVNR